MTNGGNEPISETQLREETGNIARGVLVDALITYTATLRLRGLAGIDLAIIVTDEWAAACHEQGAQAREMIDAFRERGGTIAALVGMLSEDGVPDSMAEQMIQQRMQDLEEAGEQGDDEKGAADVPD